MKKLPSEPDAPAAKPAAQPVSPKSNRSNTLVLIPLLFLIAVVLFVGNQKYGIFSTQEFEPSVSPTSLPNPIAFRAAGTTVTNGAVYLDVLGRNVAFKFTDNSGQPLVGLSVAFAMDNATNQSVLLIVDPAEKLPPRVVILKRGGTASLAPADGRELYFADPGVENVDISLDGSPNSIMPKIFLSWLPQAVDDAIGLKDATVLAAKLLDQYGLPLGKYAEKIGVAETKTQTKEEALDDLRQDVKDRVRDTLMVFVDPKELAKGKFGMPTPENLVLDTMNIAVDANAIFSCGLPGERVTVTTAGHFKFYGCRFLEMSEMTDGLVRAAVDAKDQYGQPLCSGTMSLISINNIGLGFSVPLGKDCKVQSDVPQGPYEASVHADGFKDAAQSIDVGSDGADALFNLEPTFGPPSPTPLPTIDGHLTPARDVSGKWAGTATFVEDNFYAGAAQGEVLCTWTGKFTLNLLVKGNDVIGYDNKGSSPVWSDFRFDITGHDQQIVSATGTVPPWGCAVPVDGFLDGGLDSGDVSSTSIQFRANGRTEFKGSFTTDKLSLATSDCILPSGDSCSAKDGAKWKVSLRRVTG